jgi:ribosomal-protein-serine acetyltransferase
VDRIRTVEDRTNFIRRALIIRRALKQFAENDGLQAGIWHKGRLAGVVGCHSIDWQTPAPRWATGPAKSFRARGS